MERSKDVLWQELIDLYEDSAKDADEAWEVFCKSETDRNQEIYDARMNCKHSHEKMFVHFGYAKEFCKRYPERMPWLIEEAWMDFANERHKGGNLRATILNVLKEFHGE